MRTGFWAGAFARAGLFFAIPLFFVFLCFSPLAAQKDSTRRQSVGLVLSGGGAKGLAHLGVIRALEEAQIPIDYICGTSMGAIVGGLYAAGYSVSDMEKIFYSDEFQYWFTGKVEDDYVYFFKKEPPSSSFYSFSFDTENKFAFRLPTSLMNPVQMDYAFMEIFSPATKACKGDFDSLMIPFFCVASDIEDNKQAVLHGGDLGSSIRASMTFPFVFSPIEIDGKIMFDGGMYNNFPSKEMLETYRPDMIIGVKVAGNFEPPKNGDMMSYLENMLATNSDYDVYCSNSVLIEPNLAGIGVMEFDKMKESDRLGYEAAIGKIEEIREFLLDSVSADKVQQKREAFNSTKPDLRVAAVSIQGVEYSQKPYISSIMHINDRLFKDRGAPTTKTLKKDYLSLFLDRNVSNIQPTLSYNDYFDSFVLNLDVTPSRFVSLNLGGVLSTSAISYLYAGIDYNTLHKHSFLYQTNFYLSRFYTSFALKSRVDFATSVPLFVSGELNLNDWNLFRQKSGVFSFSPINYIEEDEQNIRLVAGTALFAKTLLSLSAGIGKTDYRYFANDYGITQDDVPDHTRLKHLALGLKSEYNSLDDEVFPTHGSCQRISLQYVFAGETLFQNRANDIFERYDNNHNWLQVKLHSEKYVDVWKNFKLGLRGDLFYSLQELFSSYKASLIAAGSYCPTQETLTGYLPEYRSNQYVAFGLSNIYCMNTLLGIKLSFKASAYLYAPIRQIETLDGTIPFYGDPFRKLYVIASGAVVLRTPVGPLTLSLSYHQRDNVNTSPWSAFLTFGHVIFNNKNIDK